MRSLILSTLLFSSFVVFGQSEFRISGITSMTMDSTSKRLSNVIISVKAKDFDRTYRSSSSGRFILDSIPSNKNYVMKFSKEGFATKIVNVDITAPEKAFQEIPGKGKLELEIGMIIDSNGTYSFLEKEPVAEFYYDTLTSNLEFNRGKVKLVAKKIKVAKLYNNADCDLNSFDKFYDLYINEDKENYKKICPNFKP